MESTVLGYPRIGAQRELKKATEAYWAGRETAAGLEQTAARLRRQTWETLRDAGLSDIPSNTFSLYDHVLDTAVMFNAVPERFAGLDGLHAYFAMARGAEGVAPLELTRWFDTNYHYLVPELGPRTQLRLAGYKPALEYQQARSYDIETRPVLLGPLSFLLLSRPAEPGFQPLSLLDPLLDAYEELLRRLRAAGAQWVQLDEPVLAADRTGAELDALRHAYQRLGSALRRPAMLVSTYFGEIGDALPVLAATPVEAIGLDFVAGPGNAGALAAIGGGGGQDLGARGGGAGLRGRAGKRRSARRDRRDRRQDPGRRGGRRPQRVARGPAARPVAVRVAARPGRPRGREHVLLAAARAA